MIESRLGVYAVGSFIELFDNIVHWAVLQSFCHTGEPALMVVAQVVEFAVSDILSFFEHLWFTSKYSM